MFISGLECFVNVVIDDMLVIFYRETEDEVQNRLFKEMRKSSYRNYVKSESLDRENMIRYC